MPVAPGMMMPAAPAISPEGPGMMPQRPFMTRPMPGAPMPGAPMANPNMLRARALGLMA